MAFHAGKLPAQSTRVGICLTFLSTVLAGGVYPGPVIRGKKVRRPYFGWLCSTECAHREIALF
jgi:hypothetical protein